MTPLSLILLPVLCLLGPAVAKPLGWIGSKRAAGTFRLPVSNFMSADKFIDNRYIVVYNETYDDSVIEAKEAVFAAALRKRNLNKRSLNGSPMSTGVQSLRLNKFRATIVDADDDMFMQMHDANEVKYIEAVTVVEAFETIAQSNAPPNLRRLSKSSGALEEELFLFSKNPGLGLFAAVLDTGVDSSHPQLKDRVINICDNVLPGDDGEDRVGHGTHVAGTFAGTTFGVAKNATILSCKVLGDRNRGRSDSVFLGYKETINFARKNGISKKLVINMSLGGPRSRAMNSLIEEAAKEGVLTVVAAGNSNMDCEFVSPASAPAALTVAATDNNDVKARFSNFGASVDLNAPGVGIFSIGPGRRENVRKSGTSMSSPLTAGAALYRLSQHCPDFTEVDFSTECNATAADMKAELIKLADEAPGQVEFGIQGTTTRIVSNGKNVPEQKEKQIEEQVENGAGNDNDNNNDNNNNIIQDPGTKIPGSSKPGTQAPRPFRPRIKAPRPLRPGNNVLRPFRPRIKVPVLFIPGQN